MARIQNGADFLVALDDHSEWGHSFTVWGEMHDSQPGWETLEAIVKLPYHEQAGAGGTIMRLLDAELTTTARIVAATNGRSASAEGGHTAGEAPPPDPEANFSTEL